jgi:hypothetical protein
MTGEAPPVDLPSSGLNKLRRTLRKYETTLAVVGASIVLISFAVREELQANLRDQITRIEQARIEYDVRLDINNLSENMLHGLGRDSYGVIANRPLSSDENFLSQARQRTKATAQISDKTTEFSAIKDLAMSSGVIELKQIRSIQDRIDSVISESRNTKISYADEEKLIDFLEGISNRLTIYTRDYKDAVDAAVRKKAEALRITSQNVNTLGILLFLFGWLLGLVSRVFGLGEREE